MDQKQPQLSKKLISFLHPLKKSILIHLKTKLSSNCHFSTLLLSIAIHCVKSVHIRSFFRSVFSRIWTEYGEILFSPKAGKYGPEKTPYLGTFHTMTIFPIIIITILNSYSYFDLIFLLLLIFMEIRPFLDVFQVISTIGDLVEVVQYITIKLVQFESWFLKTCVISSFTKILNLIIQQNVKYFMLYSLTLFPFQQCH